MEHLPTPLSEAARSVAATLGAAGHEAWLVGGAVRDLALGLEPEDVDLATSARPEEIEPLFAKTHAVGKAFGTVVVPFESLEVQVTTFRAESQYDDARRPRRVSFSRTPEEDAVRRDFTCNALYLEPRTDELRDPTGGLADLERGRLRCVGEARERFSEDGLRLLRLARFAAQYALEVEPATWAGAQASLEALRGLSAERVLAELLRMARGPGSARAFGLLSEAGVLPRLPGFSEIDGARLRRRVGALGALERPGELGVLALLFLPESSPENGASLELLLRLRPARELHLALGRVLALQPEVQAVLEGLASVPRSRWIRLVRAQEFLDALAVWRAVHPGQFVTESRELVRRAAIPRLELYPALLLTSVDLAATRIPRGPRWGELLRAAEDAQLDGRIVDRASAEAWLRELVREP
jgi:tRNA nucleotidyltransferase/poly(A) polymerase